MHFVWRSSGSPDGGEGTVASQKTNYSGHCASTKHANTISKCAPVDILSLRDQKKSFHLQQLALATITWNRMNGHYRRDKRGGAREGCSPPS